jgi:hypothetical protein
MKAMVLATVAIPSQVSGARNLSGPPGGLSHDFGGKGVWEVDEPAGCVLARIAATISTASAVTSWAKFSFAAWALLLSFENRQRQMFLGLSDQTIDKRALFVIKVELEHCTVV